MCADVTSILYGCICNGFTELVLLVYRECAVAIKYVCNIVNTEYNLIKPQDYLHYNL